MFYEYDITITANTPTNAKLSNFLTLSQGVIHRVGINFPAGCHGMVFIAINAGLHQIFPTNPDGYIKGNNINVSGEVWHYLRSEPYGVTVYGWSPGTTHDHTITIRFWIKRLWQLLPYSDEMYNVMVRERGILP